MAGKYSPLGHYLKNQPKEKIKISLTFGKIEEIINTKLPKSAIDYSARWSNEVEGSHVQSHAWLNAG